MPQTQRRWFKAKTYGWGWTPATWQGWAVMLGYVVSMAGASLFNLHPASTKTGWIEFAIAAVTATALLILVCYKTGGKPQWRWG